MINSKFINKNQAGFTLVEITIVLLIVGLIFGAGVSTLGAYLDNAKQNHTMNNLKLTKRAMLDYVMVNYHMPCPDTDTGAGQDGEENREADGSCTGSVGTVPYNDIGRAQADASDDYGNVFAYGVTSEVTEAVDFDNSGTPNMGDPAGGGSQERYGENASSYFASQEVVTAANANYPADPISITLPWFGLDTYPTDAAIRGGLLETTNYTVCKKTASDCVSPAASEIEVEDIPAVIVAFNENGHGVTLSDCNGAAHSADETENCDGDTALQKRFFDNDDYDDQMVTISAYEIKQQVLDRLNGLSLNSDPGSNPYGGYDVIYLRNVTSANDINISDDDSNKYYIGVKRDDEGNIIEGDENDGNLEANAVFKGGDDELYMEGSITSSGDLKMGDGDDTLTIETDIKSGGSATIGTGNDVIKVEGDVAGSLDAGSGFDQIDIYGDISGTVVAGPTSGNNNKAEDNDIVHFSGHSVTGSLDLGLGDDTIYITQSLSSLSIDSGAIIGNQGSDKIVFENISTSDFGGSNPTQSSFEGLFSGFENFVYSDDL